MKHKKIIFLTLLVMALAACAPASGGAYSLSNSLSVTGQSQVSLIPDIAYISIGVRTEGSDVSRAVAQNAREVEDVMAALEAAGVTFADMQTTNFSVYSYDQYDFEGQPSGVTFNVENTVYITVRNLSQMGDLLDSAVGAGANSIWGIQFDVEDKSEAIAEARTMAMEDAKTQAAQLASDANVTLGEINNVSFSSGGNVFNSLYGLGGGGGAAFAESTTSIIPGQISVSASVYLSYEIR